MKHKGAAKDGEDAIAASQRLQANLQKMIDAAEKQEQQQHEMSDTQVGIRRFGMQAAEKAKGDGNAFFGKKKYAPAAKKYTSALDILDKLDEECGRIEDYSSPMVKHRWGLRVTLLGNRAEAYLRLRRWELAEQDTDAGLVIDPWNEKLLSRRRRARTGASSSPGESQEDVDSHAAASVTPAPKKGQNGSNGKPLAKETFGRDPDEVDGKYKGPSFWEVCLEQWPRTFTALGKVSAYFSRYRGVMLVTYLAVTAMLVRYVWQNGLRGMLRSTRQLTAIRR